MPFKPVKPRVEAPANPEALFRDLKSRKVHGLLTHQGEVINSYMTYGINAADVSIQLPTGSGKTPVGLLIGEWRRQKFGERVIYLCPTNQLVHQVGQQAAKFGLNVAEFTGTRSSYSPKAKADYTNADVIAVTSYSALFNSNPFFDDPQLIILDDAHTSGDYVAKPWSVLIRRNAGAGEDALADALGLLLAPHLDPITSDRIRGNWSDLHELLTVEKVPTSVLAEFGYQLRAIMDEHAPDLEDIKFSWPAIREHLAACHMYFTARELLIRPLIPPTWTHKAFSAAKQRIYMSATFGESGDLERIMGRRQITRIAMPADFETQGVGRRFFMFPERSLDDDQIDELLKGLIKKAGRALYILPDDRRRSERSGWVEDELGFDTFDAKQIETDKRPFTTTPEAVALVANRYDGIDLADDECRLLIVEDMPRSTNLQEQFIAERMGSTALLSERNSNRMVQAFGRCTRSDLDYALVVVRGNALAGRLMKKENRQILNPELQAELFFGLEQSADVTVTEFLERADAFWAQGKEWNAVNADIVALRKDTMRAAPAWTADLRASVRSEVQYVEAIWRSDFENAIGHARDVLNALTAPDLRGYRALWQYLGGVAAWYAHRAGVPKADEIARSFFREAAGAAVAVHWLRGLARADASEDGLGRERTLEADWSHKQVERIEEVLEALGGRTHDRKYAAEEREILRGLEATDAGIFESTQVRLGKMLGYEAGNKETDGAPDPWWQADENLCFVLRIIRKRPRLRPCRSLRRDRWRVTRNG